ncbi:Tryptophan-rich sensory protein [uncultured virus]|nr:Tryptophan-rich sensory protein [uncultured virus]
MVDAGWTIYAPIIIVILVAVLGFFAARRAISQDGWYNCINKASFTIPDWAFLLIWVILYILLIITWVRANATITDQTSYEAINWLFTINIILSLAWAFLFFGDGNLVAGLVIIVLMLVVTGALIFLVRSDTWAFIFLILFFIWLLYILVLNWYAITHNFIIQNHPPISCMFGQS